MIYRDCTINVKNDVSELNEDIILYRGDREVEIYFSIVESPYLYSKIMSKNIIEKTNASYAQMIIKVPNDKPPIIGDITETNEGKVVLKITGEMIDEIEENGDYDFQIRLYDDTKVSRVTIPPVLKKLHIKEPIAIEDNSTSNLVGIAKVGYTRVGAEGVQRPTLNEDQTYNKKTWIDNELITKEDLNVLEDIADKNTTNIKNHNHNTVYAKKSEIPVVDVTKQYVDTELSKKSPIHEHPYLPNTTKVPTKTSELTNDSGYLTEHQDISGKVDKEVGKGLSTNDFTTAEKEKLKGLNNYTLPTASATVLGGVKVGAGLSVSNGVLSATGGGTADSVDWGNIQNKPSVFTPDTHVHSYNDLTNKPTIPTVDVTKKYVDDELLKKSPVHEHPYKPNSYIPGWDEIQNKPSTFTPATHNHSYKDLTNKPTIPTVTNDLTNELKGNYDKAYTHSASPHAPTNAQKNSDITKEEIEAKLTGEIVTHTHPGMITAKSYVTYEEFGAKSDGVNDDGVAIKLAHEHANQNNLTVKPDSTKTYYIKQAHSIPIINSTDLNNATFVIDDTVEVDRKKNVFEVKSKKEPITIVDLNFTVKRSTVKLSNLSGHGLCLVQVVNANKKQFIREGSNSNEGTDQQDYFVIDNEGSVLTDIIWDFEQITSCTLYPFDDTTLIMKNAKFITRSNGKELQSNYFDRGLAVNRSNVILENISHRVENEQPGSPYHGFISGRYCAYLTLRNCSVQSRKAYKASGTSVWMGSYDIEMYCVVGVKLENVTDVTFDNKERWGVFASNFCKDIVVEDSTLSRVDAHQGARNITIRRSVIGNQGLRVIGSGLCLIEDSKILNSTSLITLRSDYGSSWEGILVIRRTYWKPDTTYAYPRIINFANASNHEFGYTCYFPRLIIDDLEVDDTELLSNGSYSNIPIINNNTAAFGTDITSFTHPYHFTDNIECKNMRTKSDKGFILFNSSTINLYNKNPFTYKVLESTSGNDKKLLIIPNTKIVLDNVKLAKVSRRTNASGNLFAILDASGNDGDGFTNNANHVLPLIHIKNCENVYAFTSNHPMVLELEDSVVSTLLNVGASTRMNGKATGCSFKPSIDGVYQSVNTNYGDFAFTDCKFDTPLVNSVEEKNPSNLTRIYSFLNSFDSSQNKYSLIDVKMDNCNIYDGSRNMDLSNHVTSLNGIKFWKGTQQQYTQLSSKDNSTLYIIVG